MLHFNAVGFQESNKKMVFKQDFYRVIPITYNCF